jgi:hypothetical protein
VGAEVHVGGVPRARGVAVPGEAAGAGRGDGAHGRLLHCAGAGAGGGGDGDPSRAPADYNRIGSISAPDVDVEDGVGAGGDHLLAANVSVKVLRQRKQFERELIGVGGMGRGGLWFASDRVAWLYGAGEGPRSNLFATRRSRRLSFFI